MSLPYTSPLRPLALCLLATLATAAHAQPAVTGRVTDAATGEPLPAATVQIEGTYTGTITNGEGRYELAVPERPATLVVRFIGYETARRVVEASEATADVALAPAVLQAPEVVVTDENPADVIMRRVIEAKRRWQAGLATWRADAYVRQVLLSDTAIVGLVEGVTTAYWRQDEGVREVVRGLRRTENMQAVDAEFFGAASAILNVYDDEVEFGGYDLMGPTSPDALGFYRFSLEGTRVLDDEVVYDIALRPRNRLQPGFEGRVSVLGGAWALIDVALRPSASVRFPLVTAFDLTIRQQFSSFSGAAASGAAATADAAWLPVDFRLDGEGRIGMTGLQFPAMGFRLVARLTDYAVNAAVPDSLFARDDLADGRSAVDSVAVAADTALDRSGAVVPLEPREAEAFARIDSTDTLAKAYRPTGFLARFVDMDDNDDGGATVSIGRGGRRGVDLDLEPVVWYNRVEAAHLGGATTLGLGPARLRGELGYATGLERLTYDGRLSVAVPLGGRNRLRLAVGGRRAIDPRVASPFYGRTLNSASVLVGEPDYYDYYEREGGVASASLSVRRLRARLTVFGLAERHRSVGVSSGYDLFGRGLDRPFNVAIQEGDLRSLGAELTVGRLGDGPASGLTGARGVRLRVETSGDALGSDYAFTRAEAEAVWRVPTFLQRRLIPNTLDVRLAGGVSAGELPFQRYFGIDGTVLGFAPVGVFRSLRGRPVEGERYAAAAWDHDFRTVPFELLGLEALAARNVGLSVHGAHGRTWIEAVDGAAPGTLSLVALDSSGGWIHEVGVSLHGGFVLPVRLDVTARLDRPGVFVSLGVARLF